MTGRVRILPDALADQIAAGEVVERPASVVKELLENAIDAGARRLRVEIEGGGRKRILVSDDGSGMTRDEAALAIRRHATSKLQRLEQLSAIETLGFRGEALPSIASVSRFSLLTRPRDQVAGTRVQIDGGSEPRVADAGCAPGTTVEVSDLFYNVPARLKFLKSRATETGHINQACLKLALAHPGVALSVSSDGRKVRDYTPATDFVERVRSVLEGESLVAFEHSRDGVHIEGALGAPERARSGMGGLHLFVNGRPVRDVALGRAVAYAYGSVLPPGRYPVGALSLTLPPSTVDVNVHPQKLEVRFTDARAVLDGVTRAIARKLGTSAWSGPARRDQSYWGARLGGGTPATYPSATSDQGGIAEQAPDPWGLAPEGPAPAGGAPTGPMPTAAEAAPALLPSGGFFGSLRVLGQVQRMFLVCEGTDALHILDQHAVDERIRFDALARAYHSRELQTQRLLFPERVECSDDEASLLEEHAEELGRFGLEVSRVGPRTAAVHAVPALLARASPERLLRDVLGEIGRSGERAFGDAVDTALATMACHGAIRAGDPLSIEQAQALLVGLDQVETFRGHCPHGRPVVVSLGFAELEHKLGR